MSKLIEELSTVPEWNALSAGVKEIFSKMTQDELDNLDKDKIYEILTEKLDGDCFELVSRLVMIKVQEEWRQEGNDEFDRLLKKIRGEM